MMTRPRLLGLLLGLCLMTGCEFPTTTQPLPTPSQPTAPAIVRLTYVYEKDQGGIPPALAAAISDAELSSGSVRVGVFEEDSTTGAGNVPEQFRRAKEAADKYGKPCLVAESADAVVRVRLKPQGKADVEYALKGGPKP